MGLLDSLLNAGKTMEDGSSQPYTGGTYSSGAYADKYMKLKSMSRASHVDRVEAFRLASESLYDMFLFMLENVGIYDDRGSIYHLYTRIKAMYGEIPNVKENHVSDVDAAISSANLSKFLESNLDVLPQTARLNDHFFSYIYTNITKKVDAQPANKVLFNFGNATISEALIKQVKGMIDDNTITDEDVYTMCVYLQIYDGIGVDVLPEVIINGWECLIHNISNNYGVADISRDTILVLAMGKMGNLEKLAKILEAGHRPIGKGINHDGLIELWVRDATEDSTSFSGYRMNSIGKE